MTMVDRMCYAFLLSCLGSLALFGTSFCLYDSYLIWVAMLGGHCQ